MDIHVDEDANFERVKGYAKVIEQNKMKKKKKKAIRTTFTFFPIWTKIAA